MSGQFNDMKSLLANGMPEEMIDKLKQLPTKEQLEEKLLQEARERNGKDPKNNPNRVSNEETRRIEKKRRKLERKLDALKDE